MEEIFQTLIAEIEAHPEKQLQDIIHSLSKEYNLSADDVAEISDAFAALDAINDKAIDLANQKAEGRTLNGWVGSQLENISDRVGNDSVISDIVSGVQNEVNNIESKNV